MKYENQKATPRILSFFLPEAESDSLAPYPTCKVGQTSCICVIYRSSHLPGPRPRSLTSHAFVQIVYVLTCVISFGDTFYFGLCSFGYPCPFSPHIDLWNYQWPRVLVQSLCFWCSISNDGDLSQNLLDALLDVYLL